MDNNHIPAWKGHPGSETDFCLEENVMKKCQPDRVKVQISVSAEVAGACSERLQLFKNVKKTRACFFNLIPEGI